MRVAYIELVVERDTVHPYFVTIIKSVESISEKLAAGDLLYENKFQYHMFM